MKKILILLCFLLLPAVVNAAYNDVTVSDTTTLVLPGNGLSYSLLSTTNVESFSITNTTFQFVMKSGSSFELTSSDKSDLVYGNTDNCEVLTDTCGTSQSTLKIQCTGDKTIVVTPGASSSCSATIGGSGFSVGGGGGSYTAPVSDGSTTIVANLDKPFFIEISNTTHTVTITEVTDDEITFSIESDPIIVSLAKNETKDIDTDNDGTDDLRVEYSGLQSGRPQLKFWELADVTIEKEVTLDDKDVAKAIPASACALEKTQAFRHANSNAVWYITKDCKKRAFNNSRVFFTYFGGWDEVNVVQEEMLDDISDDTLGFMPWGPKYDPKYGALVKIVSDPKVYLLLGTEKYWITDEDVFGALGYYWNWIEDIDEALLDKYITGTEINYTDRHPNFTLVKYSGNPKVYLLENGKKRHIKNEKAFEALGYRWDRIVTIEDTEEYEDGEDLESDS
jgi:hypothetical protein